MHMRACLSLIIKPRSFGRQPAWPRQQNSRCLSDSPINGPCWLHLFTTVCPARCKTLDGPTHSSSPLALSLSLPPSLPTRGAAQATARDGLGGGPPSARRQPPSSSSTTTTTTTPLPPRDATRRVARPRVSPLRRRSSPRPRGQPADALTRRRPLAAEEPPWWPCMKTGRSCQLPRRWIWSGRSRGPSRWPILGWSMASTSRSQRRRWICGEQPDPARALPVSTGSACWVPGSVAWLAGSAFWAPPSASVVDSDPRGSARVTAYTPSPVPNAAALPVRPLSLICTFC